ncbi:MAG TPA: SRPBCC family protein [Nocardioidaceae bacterium]|nr:SRPBCC family protein [Actinomycetota bacterium]HEV8056426.1 SRPBCC family protein [Nocardioidaceae bacterium]
MTTAEESIEVDVYVAAAYNQWTQFEDFPRFMEHVEEVRQIDDRHLHWKAKIAGVQREFDTEITEQIPDARIAWRSTEGTAHAGVVDFHKLDRSSTRVTLQMDMEPEGLAETAADKLGIVRRQVRKDLQSFKELIESRGHPTGAWRGDVPREG